MRAAAVYSCRSEATHPTKESLIYGQLDTALTAQADLDRHVLSEVEIASAVKPTTLGLVQIKAHDPVVALGPIAHTALADFEKRTLMTGDLDLEGVEQNAFEGNVESFVWSCSNTSRIVALGAAAWSSVQMLPVMDRRFHYVPPLRLAAQSTLSQAGVLVIDHETDEHAARGLVDLLERADIEVAYAGCDPAHATMSSSCWSNDALIHVHVGDHTLDAEEIRLVDSWCSGRLAIQLIGDRHAFSRKPHILMIENGVNGMICATSDDVLAICQELHDDRILRQKLIGAGRSTIAPLLRSWDAIAEDLLN